MAWGNWYKAVFERTRFSCIPVTAGNLLSFCRLFEREHAIFRNFTPLPWKHFFFLKYLPKFFGRTRSHCVSSILSLHMSK
jgi:hypothetical protein